MIQKGLMVFAIACALTAAPPIYANDIVIDDLTEIDCAKPVSPLAELVCHDSDLLARDQAMVALLDFASRSIRKDKPGIKLDESQKSWEERRSRCLKSYQKKKCLTRAYNVRLAFLEAKFRPGNTNSETRTCIEEKGSIFLTYGKSQFTDFVSVGRDNGDGYQEWFLAATGKTSGDNVQYAGEDNKGSQATIWINPTKINFVSDRKKYGLVCEK